MTHSKAIVIGNGPVGQTTALLLAKRGVPVLLLDGRPYRSLVGSKAICQQRDVLDVWDSVGAGRIAREGVTWKTVRNFYRDAELFSYQLPDDAQSDFPPFVNISQSRTEQLLDEQIAAQPLISVRWNAYVTSINAAGHLNSTIGEFDADFVALCAGARCDDLRSQLGIHLDGESFDDRFLICDIRAHLPGWETERRFYFDPSWNPGRQVLIHPCPASTYRIDWQVPASFDLAAEEKSGRLEQRIRAIIGDVDYDVLWKSVYRFHSRVVDKMRVGSVFLVGDSAHLYSPFGARGLNSGVADAENLAWKIAEVAAGRAADALLDSYHVERHAAALENLDVTTATMNFLIPRTPEQHEYRHQVLTGAYTDPSLRDKVDSGRLAEPFWYADVERPARGTLPVPGPGILLPDVHITHPRHFRLRSLAREGFLVLDDAMLAQIDPDGTVRKALGFVPGQAWVIRPDAYVAAVVDAAEAEKALEIAKGALDHGAL
jgi:pentachlorophenol monooxygenase/3-(3-hydroxy-phenyl)propionate hydroxylase